MAKHFFVALTNPVPGKEAEFNKFYDEIHVPDVLAAPGWVIVTISYLQNIYSQNGYTDYFRTNKGRLRTDIQHVKV